MSLRLSRFVGHRGIAAEAPENTLTGFRLAAEAGFSWVEF
ncbi:glycerophosphodiester phosphodiesterase family protein, partial [uncultured Nisaea sp.]